MKTTRRMRQCRAKKDYESSAEAQTAAEKFLAHNGAHLRPYKCVICGKHHLTKQLPYED